MKQNKPIILGQFINENAIAITVASLNEEFPNVEFEAVELGTGKYELSIVSKYGRPLLEQNVKTFRILANTIYRFTPYILKHAKGE